jgi:hypothetical protein
MNAKAPKYRVGFQRRTKGKPSILLVQISVAPEHFNFAAIKLLAQQLKKDFQHEQHLTVLISDDYDTARSSDLLVDIMRREPPPGYRGVYELDSTAGREGINFSTKRGNPINEVDIDVSNPPLRSAPNSPALTSNI